MFNYQRSPSNTNIPNGDQNGSAWGRSGFGWTGNGGGSLAPGLNQLPSVSPGLDSSNPVMDGGSLAPGLNLLPAVGFGLGSSNTVSNTVMDGGSLVPGLNLLPTVGFGLGSSNRIMDLGFQRFNQSITEVRKTIFTPRGIQIHTVVDIPASEMPRLSQSQFLNEALALRAPLLNARLMGNQNFNVNLPMMTTPNWPAQSITAMPANPVLEVEPIRSYHNYPTLPFPNGVPNNLANMNSWLGGSTIPRLLPGSTSIPKTEPYTDSNHFVDDAAVDSEETEDDGYDDDDDDNDSKDDYDYDHGDGRTHSLPHRKHGPYTCPKCNVVFPTSQAFASHVTTHYKHETVAQRRRRQAAKYKRKGLRVTQSPYGLTVAHRSFKGSNKEVGCPRKTSQSGTSPKAEVVENDEPPRFDHRRPIGGSVAKVKEEVDN